MIWKLWEPTSEDFPMSRRLKSHPTPDAALDADIAILGKKGRGKTFTAKGVVERLLQMQRRVLVLDPLSVW
jgi:Cdc6-like AAA superfamily ATPase